MPMIVKNKLRIHYRVEGERGAFLLMFHGLFGSGQDWYDSGWVSTLEPEFRLIVVDARGHGRSDKPPAPEAFTPNLLAEDVVAVMDELSIRNTHFLGYGLGALVGFELLTRFPERLRISMLGGESPFVTEQGREKWQDWAQRLRSGSLSALLEHMAATHQLSTPLRPVTDETLPGAQTILDGLVGLPPWQGDKLRPESPVTLFCAQRDSALNRIRDARRIINRARLVELPGLDHDSVISQREALQSEVVRLLRSGRRPEAGETSQDRDGKNDNQSGSRESGDRELDIAPLRGRAEESESMNAQTAAPVSEPEDLHEAGGSGNGSNEVGTEKGSA